MADPAITDKTPLAKSLFRREAVIFLITFASAFIIFIFSLGFIFQTLWDQATQSVRTEIEREADTIARLLVFEFSHLTELENPKSPDSKVDEQVKRRLWEKVTFNETIRGIELIQGQADIQGRHLTYSYFPLSHEKSESELGPQKTMKTFSGPEGDLIRIINKEQRVDKNLLESINQGRKIESELLLRYFPLYIPLPDQGAVYWGVTKVGINADAMRRFLVLLEGEKTDLRWTLIITMGIITAVAMAIGLLGSRLISRRIADPLENYAILNNALASGSGIDIKSLLAHLDHQDTQGILEFDHLQNFCLGLGGIIKSLGERLIEAERQACLGRLAAKLMQSGQSQGIWTGLFSTLPARWREVDLQPYLQQISSLLTAILPAGALSEDRQKIPQIYGHEANLVQAVLFLVDFALTQMPLSGELHWGALSLETGGVKLWLDFSGRQYSLDEIAHLLRPFKSLNEISLPLGPYLTAAIAHQHGGTLVMQPNPEGLSIQLEIPDNKGAGTSGISGENTRK